MAGKCVPEEIQGVTSFEIKDVATLNMKLWQKVQGGLMALTVVTALYLLSSLGVVNDPSSVVFVTGSVGLVSLGAAVLTGMLNYYSTALAFYEEKEEEKGGLGEGEGRGDLNAKTKRSTRLLSTGELRNGMEIGALL